MTEPRSTYVCNKCDLELRTWAAVGWHLVKTHSDLQLVRAVEAGWRGRQMTVEERVRRASGRVSGHGR